MNECIFRGREFVREEQQSIFDGEIKNKRRADLTLVLDINGFQYLSIDFNVGKTFGMKKGADEINS
mgnify:CR=1 FL=1